MQLGIGVAWVAALASCAVGCGGDASSSGGKTAGYGGDVSSFGGNTAADGGDVASSGGKAPAEEGMVFHDSPAVPHVPAPPDDACAPLHEVWAQVPPAADGSLCPTLSCSCAPGFSAYVNPRGCLVSIDCHATCSGGARLDDCLGGYDECAKDGDCPHGFCVKEEGQSTGECAAGTPRARCRTDAQCPGGRCVATDEVGRRACSTAKDGAVCNEHADCDSGHCVFLDANSFLGTCSDRVSGSPCHIVEQDCTTGLVCVGATTTTLGKCSAG
jgi:hypothetical protein